MPTGDTFTTTVEEGLETTIASARAEGEFPANVMLKVCDRHQLKSGTGTAWREALAAKLTAQTYGETSTINNPQELDLSIIAFSPGLVAVEHFIGNKVEATLNPQAFATFGSLAQNAMDRKLDEDGVAVFAQASVALGGSGTTQSSHISAAVTRILSDADEPGPLPIHAVLHGYQLHDIQSEILGGVGTYPIPEGYTAQVFNEGYKGQLGITGAHIWVDGLIAVSSTPTVRGGVFSKMAIVLIQGIMPWKELIPEPRKGYGGVTVILKNDYQWGERSPGNWLYGELHDGTVPS